MAGFVALGVALPLVSSQAGEPMRLDLGQLDSVTAGAAAGFTLGGDAAAYGTVRSRSAVDARLRSTSSPTTSVASGVIVAQAVGIGGIAPPPSATTNVGASDVVGQKVYYYPVNVAVSGPGYAARFDVLAVVAVSSEFPF